MITILQALKRQDDFNLTFVCKSSKGFKCKKGANWDHSPSSRNEFFRLFILEIIV